MEKSFVKWAPEHVNLSYIFNTMAAALLAPYCRASATMALTYFSQNIPDLAPEYSEFFKLLSISVYASAFLYLPETHLKPKSCEISFAHNFSVTKSFWNFAQNTSMLCAKFRNDWTTEVDVLDKQGVTRFEFKMSYVSPYVMELKSEGGNGKSSLMDLWVKMVSLTWFLA